MSDDYTPTTADVRDIYASGSFVQTSPTSYGVDEGRGGAEFDRWLAAHDRQVLDGYVKTPSLEAVAAAISTQCGPRWEDIGPMSREAYDRMAQAVLDLFEEARDSDDNEPTKGRVHELYIEALDALDEHWDNDGEFDRWFLAHHWSVAEAGWNECIAALAWTYDNGNGGVDVAYVAANNPYRQAPHE